MTNRERIIEEEFKFEDASASSFGWNFQANAGLYLFIKKIKETNAVGIETKYQDIVLSFNDGSHYFAQAKSAQKPNDASNAVAKFKDAIVSLAKTPTAENDKLIYISNLDTPVL